MNIVKYHRLIIWFVRSNKRSRYVLYVIFSMVLCVICDVLFIID